MHADKRHMPKISLQDMCICKPLREPPPRPPSGLHENTVKQQDNHFDICMIIQRTLVNFVPFCTRDTSFLADSCQDMFRNTFHFSIQKKHARRHKRCNICGCTTSNIVQRREGANHLPNPRNQSTPGTVSPRYLRNLAKIRQNSHNSQGTNQSLPVPIRCHEAILPLPKSCTNVATGLREQLFRP